MQEIQQVTSHIAEHGQMAVNFCEMVGTFSSFHEMGKSGGWGGAPILKPIQVTFDAEGRRSSIVQYACSFSRNVHIHCRRRRKRWCLEVFCEVKRGFSIAKWIRNIIPITLVVWKSVKPEKCCPDLLRGNNFPMLFKRIL